jgi:uncharacterized membrane protein YoaK (UPF0700 family)
LFCAAQQRDRRALMSGLTYLMIIALFIVGAGVGAAASAAMGLRAALPAAAVLLVPLMMMFGAGHKPKAFFNKRRERGR